MRRNIVLNATVSSTVNSTGSTQRQSREARYKSSTIRESLKIKSSKCDSSKPNINRDDGSLVKANKWTHLLRNINDLKNAVRNCKAD